jgi:hypothetical protein
MTDHYREAERLSKPQPHGLAGFEQDPASVIAPEPMLPADLAAAQFHATLAVADQLARIAGILEKLIGRQEGGASE